MRVARRVVQKRRASRTQTPVITPTKTGTRATVKGNETFSKPAFTRSIVVPVGGFRPRTARAFPMQKPEGTVFRARTHVKNAGRKLTFEGYFSTAVDEVMLRRQNDLRELAHQLGQIGALEIVQQLKHRGVNIQVSVR